MARLKDKPPAFQFWAKEWLASSNRRMMSPHGQCAYINLLCSAWDSDPVGTIPNQPEHLWRIAEIPQDEWKKEQKLILSMFEEDKKFPGRLVQRKLRDYYEHLMDLREERSERGKKGADARWGNGGTENEA